MIEYIIEVVSHPVFKLLVELLVGYFKLCALMLALSLPTIIALAIFAVVANYSDQEEAKKYEAEMQAWVGSDEWRKIWGKSSEL